MIPDFFEALTGYRAWGALSNGLLTGLHQMEPWPPYEPFVARCAGSAGANQHQQYSQRNHLTREGRWLPAPHFHCSCGIYAQASTAAAVAELQERAYYEMSGYLHPIVAGNLEEVTCRLVAVWGPVRVWGRVILHERGFRAEKAYPASLTCTANAWPGFEQRVATIYGVPCVRDTSNAIVLSAAEYVKRQPATRWHAFDQYADAVEHMNQMAGGLYSPFFRSPVVTVHKPGALALPPAPSLSTTREALAAARKLFRRI